MCSIASHVLLNNGRNMPVIGLGSWNIPRCDVGQVIKNAINTGYRHFDCAHIYGNEFEIGQAIADKINEGCITRKDVFITTKLWNTFHRPDLVRCACETTLKTLGLSYVDMYLIHWPMAFLECGDLHPVDDKDKPLYSNVNYCDTWREMEKLVHSGLSKSIGVSNFNKRQIENVLSMAHIVPAINQVECHPYLPQRKLMEFCACNKILLSAYCPLGSPNRPGVSKNITKLLEHTKIIQISKKYFKTPAQILIRYQIDRGNVVIPKSTNKKRIESNFDVFGFEITKEDLDKLDSLDCNLRFLPYTLYRTHKDYPFHDEF